MKNTHVFLGAIFFIVGVVLISTAYLVVNQNTDLRTRLSARISDLEQLIKVKDNQLSQTKQQVEAPKMPISEEIDDVGFARTTLIVDSKARTIEYTSAQFQITYPRDASLSVDEKGDVSITKNIQPFRQLSVKILSDKNLDSLEGLFSDLELKNCTAPERTKNDMLYVECEQPLTGQKLHNYFKPEAPLIWFSFTGDKKDWDAVLATFTPAQ